MPRPHLAGYPSVYCGYQGLAVRAAYLWLLDHVENPGISYSNILILIPDSRMVYDLIFMLFILLTLSR